MQIIFSQTAEELKQFMDTYGKIKVDQQADQIVKGIESEKSDADGPVKLLIKPSDITKYYRIKMDYIQNELEELSMLLIDSDSIPPLSHFGYNYFSVRDSIQFIDNANVSTDYILGYGDEVIISIWGQAEQYERKTLERDGTIFIDNVGLLYLGGKTQEQAKSYVTSRFSKVYSTLKSNPKLTFIEFSIGKTKNINISVAGHVQFPGNYVVNPSISIPNVLVLAGGINNTGTLRNIIIQRNNSIKDSLDLYPLITGIGMIKNKPLLEGDIIIVPPRGKTIAITGNVLTPAYFEVKPNENMSMVLKYTVSDYNKTQLAIISRNENPNLYVSNKDFNKFVFSNGDSLVVPIPYFNDKYISVSVSNRPMTTIPWTDDILFNEILQIITLGQQEIKSIELIRKNKINNKYEPTDIKLNEIKNLKFSPMDHLSIHLYESFVPAKDS